MELNIYQLHAKSTVTWVDRVPHDYWGAVTYCSQQLAGESGEVAGKLAKVWRDSSGVISGERRHEIALEMGDVLWYLAVLSDLLDYSLNDIAQMNVDKLASRKARGVLHGSGDNR